MRDIEWLKEEVQEKLLEDKLDGINYFDYKRLKEDIWGLIDQLDTPETLSQEWIDNHTAGSDTIAHYSEEDVPVVTVYDLENLLVPKLNLPVIPDYVAEYITSKKENSFPLYQAIRIVLENSRFTGTKLKLWLCSNENQEIFAKAWVIGYTVEEKKYQIHFGNHKYAQRFNDKWLSSQITDKEFASTFTKEEIIKLDNSDLYWNNFAEEATE